MASNVERYSTAAAGLVVVAAFWSVVHPPSYHLLRCIAAAMPIYAGYAETARACATNRIPPGSKGTWPTLVTAMSRSYRCTLEIRFSAAPGTFLLTVFEL